MRQAGQRMPDQLHEQVAQHDEHGAGRVLAQYPDRAERPDREQGRGRPGDENVARLRQGGCHRVRGCRDRDQLEHAPADALRDVERRSAGTTALRRTARAAAPWPARRSGRPAARPARPGACRAAVPTTIAVSAAASESSGVPAPPGCRTKMAPVKPSRLTPRLPHSPNWSNRLSACGTGSARVRATSACRSPGTMTKVLLCSLAVVAATAASLRRHYPDRFRRSAARGGRASHPLSPVSPSSRACSVHPDVTGCPAWPWCRPQPPIADIGRSGCRNDGSLMPWPGSFTATARRHAAASSASLAPARSGPRRSLSVAGEQAVP